MYCDNCGEDEAVGGLTEIWGEDGSMDVCPGCYDKMEISQCPTCEHHVTKSHVCEEE